jgi:GGDEF domain-containing protein
VEPSEKRSAEEILRDADQAMYQAKRTGQATSRYEHAQGRKPAIRRVIGWLRGRR